MHPAITVHSLSKRFRCYGQHRPRTIMEAALSGWRGIRPSDYFWALRDISFTVAPREMLGVIGRNGAGKSTLLRLLGQVGQPEKGKIILNGRVGALLDLGSGFHPDLTGRENVLVNGVVAGLLEREARRQFDSIVEFAELANFIDSPVRTYSSGMMMRLAFSVAIHTDPEILLVDEFLSVGDQSFQNKCLNRIDKMKAAGCAVVFVSHSLEQVEKLCDRAIWLNQGQICAEGETKVVVEQYRSAKITSTSRPLQQVPDRYPDIRRKKAKDKLSTPPIESLSVPGLSLYEDVMAYPLSEGKTTRHQGGLISCKTKELIDEAILREEVPLQEPPDCDALDLKDHLSPFEHPCLYGGILYNHLGHFLMQSLNRLWAYHAVENYDPFISFYAPWGVPDYLGSNNFVNQVLQGFEIPLDRIMILDQPMWFKKMMIPSQKYGFSCSANLDDAFLSFVKRFHWEDDLPEAFENADKVYVSRTKMPFASGRPIGEEQFEVYLQDNGYRILHPEYYSTYQKLTILNNARQIIFCDGAAINHCILLPNLKADVAIVSRRKEAYSANYNYFMNQFRSYGQTAYWIDAVVEQYQFGQETWNCLAYVDWYEASQALKQLGFVDTVFSTNLNRSAFIEKDLQQYIQEIADKPSFIQFMLNHKELIREET